MNSKKAADYMFANEKIMNAVLNSEYAMRALGKSKYAGYKAIVDETLKNKILTSKYVGEFDKGSVSVPVLTSNVQQIIYSTYYPGQEPYEAFDGNDGTAWASNAWDIPGYIGYDFEKNVIVYKSEIVNCGDNAYGYRENFQTAIIQYYDNETATYVNASETKELDTDMNSNNRQIIYPSGNFTSSKWILKGLSAVGGKYLACKTLQFYAREIPNEL